MTNLGEENLIRQFLLGELSPGEREHIEERLFADENFFHHVDAIEEELIEDYLRGRLRAPERERFEQHFLITNERQERLDFASALYHATAIQRQSAAEPPPFQTSGPVGFWAQIAGRHAPAFGVAIVLLVLGLAAVIWLSLPSRHQQDQVAYTTQPPSKPNPPENNTESGEGGGRGQLNDEPTTAERQTDKPNVNKGLTEGGVKPKPRVPYKSQANENRGSSTFSIALTSGGAGRGEGEGLRQFAVPKDAKAVRLDLRLDEADELQHESYEAELQDGNGQSIYREKGLRAVTNQGGRYVPFNIPAISLPRGDYQIVLRSQGAGIPTRYYFRVVETHAGRDRTDNAGQSTLPL